MLKQEIMRLLKRISFSSLHGFIFNAMLLKNSIGLQARWCVIIYTMLLVASCRQNPEQVDVSAIPVTVVAERFDEDLFSTKGENISFLKNKYRNFFDLFCYKIINSGTPDTMLLKDRLRAFSTDADMMEVYALSEKNYHDFTVVNRQLTDAFRHYKYYFPKKMIPPVYAFISGFNYAVVAADSALGVGLDMYLGSEAKYYPSLQYPHYKIVRMRKEYVAADCMRGWIQSEWEEDQTQSDLLSRMIYAGKILYCMNAMMPDVADSIKIGYTGSQLKWCTTNEKNTWSFFIDQKLLFTNDQNQVSKFINDGPTTNGFPKESPGAVGQWVGWKIVQAYMKNNTSVTLEQLMSNNDNKKILNDSKYKPGK
jgi:gliding motility-associated lipoprotein GldB